MKKGFVIMSLCYYERCCAHFFFFLFFGVRSNFNKLEDFWPWTGVGMSSVQSAWSTWITKKHSASASAMAPRRRGATPFHQCRVHYVLVAIHTVTHAVMLILVLVLVLKESLRTNFKSLSLSLPVQCLKSPWWITWNWKSLAVCM